ADPLHRSNKSCEQRPRQPLRKKKPPIRQWPALSHGARPAHLMVPETAKCLRGIHRPDGFTRENNLASGFGDTVAEFIVVCKGIGYRSEEHTSELQSRFDLVCRLLLEKKKTRD